MVKQIEHLLKKSQNQNNVCFLNKINPLLALKAFSKSTKIRNLEIFFTSVYEMALLIKQLFSTIERLFKKPIWLLSTKVCKTALRHEAITLDAIL